ncbi:outer membrane protein assembly factor BamA, partial [Candidatus Thioglobus sp.]|uniref:outer membrane protein assembly factor BamA n=1 Tax=Candidatus Thioglobus sp. TaxID=2026721 RepID=UPI00261CAC86
GTVLSYLPVETGDDYNSQISGKIIRDLYKTSFFKDIEVSQVDQILKIVLKENPHIKYIDVLNYSDKVIDEDSLKQILKKMDLSQGKIFNKRQLDELISQLKASYISKGYYGINISKKIEVDTQNRVGIELDISEGDVAKISSMVVTGGKVHDENDLLDLFEIGEADFFIMNYFTEKDHYSKVALDAGIEAMKSLYINSGYLDFKINKVAIELSEDKQNIAIDIQINEGKQYKLGVIKFSGDLLNQSIEDLQDLLSIKQGDIFERKKVIESIQAITDVFADQGYAFAKIDPITTESAKTHSINLNIDITLNKKVYINRITIVGNTRTQDEVIRREIDIDEGGLYSNTELEESLNKIKRLGFFTDVTMEVIRVSGFDDRINLQFNIEETKTGAITMGIAHSNGTGTSFELGIQERNFLGTGTVLNAKMSNSDAVKEFKFYFSDPYFTMDKHSISYGVFSKQIENLEGVGDYKIDTFGGSLGYGIPITDTTRIGTELKVSSSDVECTDAFALLETQCSSTDKSKAKINLNWSSNTLNDYNHPTDGYSTSVNFDIALPIADLRYYKLDLDHRNYTPFGNGLTLKTNGTLGLAKGYSGKELPFFERYYGGGSSSVRGFDFNSLGAKYIDSNGNLTETSKGGELSILSGISIISPMNFVSDSKNMRMSAFIDAGGIYEKVNNISFDDLRVSAGVAFSWLTPVGPLGVYAAKPLVKKSGDNTKTVEFTLGTSF